jgi:hypothetical protein
MSVQPNNGKIAQTNFRLKSNNVPGVLRLILNAKGLDFESLKLKLSAIFSYRDLDLTS